MTKVTCCPTHLLPSVLEDDTHYITLFGKSGRKGVGHAALNMEKTVRSSKLAPSIEVWDFVALAVAVDAADKSVSRGNSADGWTRMIDLTVHLVDPTRWETQRETLSSLLRFLTGDFWTLHFRASGMNVPAFRHAKQRAADCVCLLSGGMDSLIGAIDLTSEGRSPLFVSHIVRGSGESQRRFAGVLGGADRHFQWSCAVVRPKEHENSTRGRSLLFFAFAALAASALPNVAGRQIDVVVPENGFISLNVPMSPGRVGSLSTKTTHPVYMSGIQSVWNAVGINARLVFPYRDKTKGEMILGCTNRVQLSCLIGDSVSCGTYQRHNLQHCGECVPCLIRRAAYAHARLTDATVRGYLCSSLRHAEGKNVAAAATACIRYRTQGVRRFLGGSLAFADASDRVIYEGVVARGLEEMEALLNDHGVI